MSTQYAVVLTPVAFEARIKTFCLGEVTWKRAIGLVARAGYSPNVVGGLVRGDVPRFARYIRQGLATQDVQEEDRAVFERLADFLTGPAANAGGVTLSRGWRRLDQP